MMDFTRWSVLGLMLAVSPGPIRARPGPSASGAGVEPRQEVSAAAEVDLAGSFTLRMLVRWQGDAPADLPTLASNKDWEGGEVRDYTTNNSYGLGRESGRDAGFAISVLPDGAWTWNAGDGERRIDHRPESADQPIVDGRWHEVGFAIDRGQGVARLFHDGRRVALHDLQGVGGLGSAKTLRLGRAPGLEISEVRLEPGVVQRSDIERSFVARFGEDRRPAKTGGWDGRPLRVLAWNIWHGGRRMGRDEGVARVVEVIEQSGADIVLMQETYGSGPRISGRLGFDYYLRSSNLSILSRYPIVDVHRLYQGFRFGGATIELTPGVRTQVYSLWINHLPSVEKALDEGASGEELEAADAETRGAEISAILDELLPHLHASPAMPVLVGGDFNSGSHLDWTEEASALSNHHGRVVDWPVSRSMERAGFVDTFRTVHRSPITSPGHTWSPEYPETHQDRIDYVYASRGDWISIESRVLNQHPRGWPSDHAAVLSTLQLSEPPPSLKVMSYNIHYGVGMDKKLDLERIAAIITAEEPDLVGLQEIGSRAMAETLSKLTGMRVRFGPSKGSDEAYGDAVLSRFPFEWIGNASIPSASSSRYQAMAVDVDLSERYGAGAKVRFVNTHFDWTDSIGSQESRRAAVEVIERAFCSDLAGPALLAGDLNAAPGSLPLQDAEERGWYLPPMGQPVATCPSPSPDEQIDYVLIRPRQAWRTVDMRVLDAPVASDHLPVVLTVRPVW